MLNQQLLAQYIQNVWQKSILSELTEYIAIPNKSPNFDKDWENHGYMDQAVQLICNWCKKQSINNLHIEVVRLPNRTPLIFMEIPGQTQETILLYGHLDKQPEMTGWRDDLDPWTAVLQGDKLYGRGGADDGYAAFSIVTALSALQQQKIPHARCVVIIEASEESGSTDLPAYLEKLSARIGSPDFVICLDSGCGNYEQLWSTTSLRGLVNGTLRIDVLKHGVHSGSRSGVAPSSFSILRTLLDRIENSQTGAVLLPEANTVIPEQRQQQAIMLAETLGSEFIKSTPLLAGVKPISNDLVELILNATWKPTLCVTGVSGIPAIANAGNVLLPYTEIKLSMRLPPNCDEKVAAAALKRCLESEPPHGAKVNFTVDSMDGGWDAPPLADWLAKASDAASMAYYGNNAAYLGEGGSIPFMGMLGKQFPEAQFLITGVLGPNSNAHGPNEFLHIPAAKKLTTCVADIIAAHYRDRVGV